MRSLLEDLHLSKQQLEAQARELQLANARLEELSALKDELIAKVSHELRTPITSIKEGLSLLMDGVLGKTTSEQQDFLKTMDGDMDRLAEFVTTMLDVSTIEAGRMRLRRDAVDLRPLLESTIISYHLLAGRRTVRVDAGGAPPVFADPDRIRQVVTNLLSNALKHTRDDGTIVFRLERRGDLAAFTITDNGDGIAPEDLPKLFHKFTRVGLSEASGRPGTGLGLVLCKELVELHGGRIEVAAELGQGAAFTVLLPVYTDRFALTESFEELRRLTAAAQEQPIGLVVVQIDPLAEGEEAVAHQRERLRRAADEVRRHLYRGDTTLTFQPSWIVVLAATDAAGVKAIVKRLSEWLRGDFGLHFGVATYPADATGAIPLFECAMARVGQGAAIATPPTREGPHPRQARPARPRSLPGA